MTDQGDLLPYPAPPTIELMLERARRRVASMASQLSPEDCLVILGEIALLETQLDKIERWHLIKARFIAPPAPARPPLPSWALDAARRPPQPRVGRAQRSPIAGTKSDGWTRADTI